jgi:HSP20 family molecular chaperone IbpA
MNKSIFFGSVLAAFALGGAAMWTWQQHRAPAAADNTTVAAVAAPGSIINPQSFPAMADPFRAMEAMRKQMEAMFAQDDFFDPLGYPGHSGSWFGAQQGGFGSGLEAGEDDHSVFYKLDIGDQDVSDLNVTVENGYVSINARLDKKSSNARAQSTLSESFPVPSGVDPDSAKVDKENDAIVIRFEKVS